MNNKRIHMVIYGSSYAFSPIFESNYHPEKLSELKCPRMQITPRCAPPGQELYFTDDVNKVFNVVKTDTCYIFGGVDE